MNYQKLLSQESISLKDMSDARDKAGLKFGYDSLMYHCLDGLTKQDVIESPTKYQLTKKSALDYAIKYNL